MFFPGIKPDMARQRTICFSNRGGENNMNAMDDGRLTKSLRLRVVMPMHWDRFRG